MSCPFDTPEAQARLPHLVAAAPDASFPARPPWSRFDGRSDPDRLSCARTRRQFRLLLGESADHRGDGREGIPVVGHLGLSPSRHLDGLPRHRQDGRGGQAALRENEGTRECGAYAAELEVVPHPLATFLSKNTSLILMSLDRGPVRTPSFSSRTTFSGSMTNGSPARQGLSPLPGGIPAAPGGAHRGLPGICRGRPRRTLSESSHLIEWTSRIHRLPRINRVSDRKPMCRSQTDVPVANRCVGRKPSLFPILPDGDGRIDCRP